MYVLVTFFACLAVLWWLFFTTQGLNVFLGVMLILMAALATPVVLLSYVIVKALWFS
jgi:hypothetical protein